MCSPEHKRGQLRFRVTKSSNDARAPCRPRPCCSLDTVTLCKCPAAIRPYSLGAVCPLTQQRMSEERYVAHRAQWHVVTRSNTLQQTVDTVMITSVPALTGPALCSSYRVWKDFLWGNGDQSQSPGRSVCMENSRRLCSAKGRHFICETIAPSGARQTNCL